MQKYANDYFNRREEIVFLLIGNKGLKVNLAGVRRIFDLIQFYCWVK